MATYVALGDSITAFREDVKVYFEFLQEQQAELGFDRMINSGVPGWNTRHLLEALEEKCLQYHPHAVTLMLGTNDHAVYSDASSEAVSVKEYEENLREIIRRIQQDGLKHNGQPVCITLMTPPFIVTDTNTAGTKASQTDLLAYVAVIKKLCAELGLGLIDVNAITGEACGYNDRVFYDTFTHKNDGCHLNTKGQQLLVEPVRQALLAKA